MNLFLQISIVFLCSILVYQDFKFRQISWIPLPLLLAALFFLSYQGNALSEIAFYFGLNFIFILAIHICLFVFLWVKNKKVFNPINTYHGIGDVLFSVVLCMAFSPMNFIHFYIATLLLTLFGYMVYLQLKAEKSKGFPTAGVMSLALGLCFVYKMIKGNVDFYSDYLFFGYF
jgi:hypothetical protein